MALHRLANSTRLRRRAIGLVVAAGAGSVLALAAALNPDGRGHGTHEQLGLPACGWAIALDAPCPTCGMTTSWSFATAGDPVTAAATQPAGFLLALAAAAAVAGGLHAALSGAATGKMFRPLLSGPGLWTGVALLVLAWVYKMMAW